MSEESILTPVSADVINSNFTLLEDLVNTKADLNGDSTEIFNVADATESTHAVNLGQLESYMPNSLTPNSINSGALSSGNPNVLSYSGNVVTLAANTTYTNYLKATNTTAGVLTVDIPTTPVSATWNLFIEGGALVAYNNARYIQKTQPTGSTDAVWFNTSKEPVIQYKWDNSSAFVSYTGVYCGQAVTNASGVVSSIVQPRFNENGYVANRQTVAKMAMPSSNSISVTLASTASSFLTGSYYTAPANGYFSMGGVPSSSNNFIYIANGNVRAQGFGNTSVAINIYLPCQKGQSIYYQWYNLQANSFFANFTYAEGEL